MLNSRVHSLASSSIMHRAEKQLVLWSLYAKGKDRFLTLLLSSKRWLLIVDGINLL